MRGNDGANHGHDSHHAVALLGLTLAYGGIVLVTSGGSPYYVLAGLGVFASAVALAFRRHYAALLYAVVLLGTLLWSVWEVGLDDWPLAPRLIALAFIGLLFLLPPILRASGMQSRWWIVGPVLAMTLTIVVCSRCSSHRRDS
jgi:quinoprotein glucose dehydrogenase